MACAGLRRGIPVLVTTSFSLTGGVHGKAEESATAALSQLTTTPPGAPHGGANPTF